MILYRTSGPWGPGVGANLTADQVDGNFYDVSARVQYLELNPTQPVQITSFSSVGNQLYINMSDGTVQGPLAMPVVKWNFRGTWVPSTVYTVDDVVTAPDGAVYLVIFTHTSGVAFSPGANDGAGHNFYSLLLKVPAATMPIGGVQGDVLTKLTGNDYNVVWSPPQSPPGGSTGQVLRKNSAINGDAGWSTLIVEDLGDTSIVGLAHGDYLRYDGPSTSWINAQSPTLNVLRSTSWSPVVGDSGAFMVLTNDTTATTIAIPNDSVQLFPTGAELHIHQDGTGAVTVVGDTGVTVYRHAYFSNQLLGQYATATVKKTGVNEWRLFGLLAAV